MQTLGSALKRSERCEQTVRHSVASAALSEHNKKHTIITACTHPGRSVNIGNRRRSVFAHNTEAGNTNIEGRENVTWGRGRGESEVWGGGGGHGRKKAKHRPKSTQVCVKMRD